MVNRDGCVPREIEKQMAVLKGRQVEDLLLSDIVATPCLGVSRDGGLLCGGPVD